MATLTASFLADLDELSDNEETRLCIYEELSTDDVDDVSKLQKSHCYMDIMQKVEDALSCDHIGDPEYDALIVDCNALSIDIENEIFIIHNFIRDKYRLKFPELESLVNHPIDYARVVKKIGNAMDMTLVDLEGLLPSAIIMVVSVTASTTSGKPLPQDVLHKTLEACDRALSIDSAKKKVVDFVESRMGFIAPNLSAVVGSRVAAKLIATAGGLSSLANIPSDYIQLLGAKRNTNNLAGFSFHHIGGCYIEQTEIIQTTPPSFRKQAYRLLADKSILAARMDSARGDPTGQYGTSLRGIILNKIEKLQELPPAKQPKPLPVPADSNAYKKKRGGGRKRKMNKRYKITERQKLANRIKFGVAEESSLGDGLGKGYGMLGQAAGIGKLRLSIIKVAKKKFKSSSSSTRASSGLTSSLAFTPVQGIELSNPDQAKHASPSRSTYFSETATFIFQD